MTFFNIPGLIDTARPLTGRLIHAAPGGLPILKLFRL